MLNAGIYAIWNKVNKKKYIGQAVNLANRKKNHIIMLNNNKHYNKFLQMAWTKYSAESFAFEILEYVFDIKELTVKEQYYINKYFTYKREFGYNLSPAAGSLLGVKHTDEFKAKISAIHKGRKHSKEWTDKIAKALTGKKASAIARINISKGLTGRKLSKEHIKNRTLAQGKFIWPCLDGHKCKCENCKDRRSIYHKQWRMNKMKENANG